jgi:mevalonate kinase
MLLLLLLLLLLVYAVARLFLFRSFSVHTTYLGCSSPMSSSNSSSDLLRSVASAPGKLILFGEHAVVHDRPAVAVATSLRTTASLEQTHNLDIVLCFPDICTDVLSLPLQALQPCFSLVPSSPGPCHQQLLQLLQSAVAHHATQQQASSAAFLAAAAPALFLLVTIVAAPCCSSPCGLRLHVQSELPVGAGLGSSAAFSVSVTAAALQLRELSAARSQSSPSLPCSIACSTVNDWALQASTTDSFGLARV